MMEVENKKEKQRRKVGMFLRWRTRDDDDFEPGSEDRVGQTGKSDFNLLITLCLSSVSGRLA